MLPNRYQEIPNNDWKELKFWQCGEWQVCKEQLNEFDQLGVRYCPERARIFRALSLTSIADTKVAIMGQDPYPNPEDATGVAFSVPEDRFPYPPSLLNLFKEYYSDLRAPYAKTGCLEKWCERGVLLWNVYPICLVGDPASCHWTEWDYLTAEIVKVLHDKGVLIVTLGAIARNFTVDYDNTINWSHPSPLGYTKGSNPLSNSRMFTSINSILRSRRQPTIDWRLPT